MTRRVSNRRILKATALALAAAMPATAPATTKYWDINGATAGAGGATPAGTWDTTTTNWSTDPNGALAATTWAANDSARFSAGAYATGSYTVTVSGNQSVTQLGVEEGNITFTGGTLTFTGN